jgi:hypothetical protein
MRNRDIKYLDTILKKSFKPGKMYKEIKPTGVLAQYFDVFWYSKNLTPVQKVTKILQDGCSDVIYSASLQNSLRSFIKVRKDKKMN